MALTAIDMRSGTSVNGVDARGHQHGCETVDRFGRPRAQKPNCGACGGARLSDRSTRPGAIAETYPLITEVHAEVVKELVAAP
jgi:hypothetical protein